MIDDNTKSLEDDTLIIQTDKGAVDGQNYCDVIFVDMSLKVKKLMS